MNQEDEKKNLKKEENKKVHYDVSHCKIHVVDGAVIEVDEAGGRILFFNFPMLNASDGSISCQCPVEIRMTKKVLLEIVDDLTLETVTSLIKSDVEEIKECMKEKLPEVMFA